MNNKIFFLSALLAVFSCLAVGCKDDYDLPIQPVESYDRVYMPQAANGPVLKTLPITDQDQVLVFGANFGGLNFPDNDIAVSFSIDQQKADSFNTANGSQYAMLPEESYTVSATEAVIHAGQLNSEALTINIRTKGDGAMPILKTFILPVTLHTKSGTVNENLRTTFFLVQAMPDIKNYPNFDRSSFQIIGFSSQEADGEGANNGRAVFVFDNEQKTFWHSQWKNGSPVPPHYLTIDMGEEKELHGLGFIGRVEDRDGRPNEVNVQVSADNVNWTNAGTFNLQNVGPLQNQFLPEGFKKARYFKIVINSCHNSTVTHLAELFAF
ncbi:MAG: DUF1735 domain-containing protein [Candidatus Pseudobacter hemicellulosilyticus]|uniref:DUF1735 domain-containing protein n=1 Tax=Candidatus Pseudobacter hemicellulosilyticus TaxID=3121375 RepID=A0AAJ5WVQ6_9BACT|nr:MAG: DUF1735 domain-containing protein [Pseudobacter sp.]